MEIKVAETDVNQNLRDIKLTQIFEIRVNFMEG